MSRALPERPNLEHLKKQAKALLRDFAAGKAEAVEAFGSRRVGAPAPTLADAQHALARSYGFPNWAQLKHHVLSLAGEDPAAALEAAVFLNDAQRVRDVIARFPAVKRRLDEALPGGAFGATPLITAAKQRNLAMIDVLLEAGANIDQRSHWWAGGFSAFGPHVEVNAHLIARGAMVDAHDAAQLGMIDRLRELIEADPSVVTARYGDGQTPLHVASTVEIAELLLAHGADIDALDVDHESTPAQYLVGDHPEIVRMLIARGCRTDILLACAVGDVALVREHLDRDPASVYTMVSARWFPMRDPRAGGTIYIWTLGNYRSAHAVARRAGHDDVYELLMERSPADLRLAAACDAGDGAEVERQLAAGDVAAASLTDQTRQRILSAASQDDAAAVRLMLKAGWPATVSDDAGATPLHWAAWHGNAALVRALLSAGADPTAEERHFGGTPLGWAEHGERNSWRREEGDYDAVRAALGGEG